MVTLNDIANALVPKITALQAEGHKLADLQVVLGDDTFKAIKADPIFAQEALLDKDGKPTTILGVDYVVDTGTPRLHSVRVKLGRRRANA